MRIVMFVGPSLPAPPVRRGVETLAPAGRGDVVAAARAGARVIGLADGVLGPRLAVSNGEIREAAREGARLYGAASIGALRAVECPDVMIGMGAVYESLRSGELTDDDEVACTYAMPEYVIIAHPLVTIRAALAAVAARDARAAAASQQIIGDLKALPFHERTGAAVRRVVSRAAGNEVATIVGEALADPRHDPKRADALLLLDSLAGHSC